MTQHDVDTVHPGNCALCAELRAGPAPRYDVIQIEHDAFVRGYAAGVTAGQRRSTDQWTTSDVASYLGVAIGTVSSYRGRGQMPAPTAQVERTWVWDVDVIIAWAATRPRSQRAKADND